MRVRVPGWQRRRRPGSSAWLPATLAAAIWLINPIQLAGVVLVVQRMTLLMALFLLLGLLAYLHGLLEEQASPRADAASGCCSGWGLHGPFVPQQGKRHPAAAYMHWCSTPRCYAASCERLPVRLLWWRQHPIWPVVLFIFGFLIWIIPAQWGHPGIRHFTVGERLLTEPRVLLNYLDKIFLPRFGVFGLYHDGYLPSHSLISPWTTLPAMVIVLSMALLALIRRRRWPLFALAVLWYLGGQLIESSSAMLELYFEHRNYTPLIGIVMALALALARMAPDGRRRLVMGLGSLWLAGCIITTALSAHVYDSQDNLALTWAHAQPNSIRAQSFLAQRLVKHGQYRKAEEVIDAVAKRHPEDSMLAENRVYLRCLEGSLRAEDILQLEKVLSKAPFDRGGFTNMATLRKLAFGGSCSALNPKNWLRLTDILLANPAYGHDSIANGYLHYQRHFWAVSKGNLDMAIHELDLAYRSDPDTNIPRLEANYLSSAGLYDQSIEVLRNTVLFPACRFCDGCLSTTEPSTRRKSAGSRR